MLLNYQINHLFCKICYYLGQDANENGAFLVMDTISSLASQFNRDQICEAKNFQYRWEEIKPLIKMLALTNDFKKMSQKIDQELEEVLEPEKWEDRVKLRINGSIEAEIERVQDFFYTMPK